MTLRGKEATIVWCYHTAAVMRDWTVYRTPEGDWSLQAVVSRADPFQLRQQPLIFRAPRVGGFFAWPVKGCSLGARAALVATLGPPLS